MAKKRPFLPIFGAKRSPKSLNFFSYFGYSVFKTPPSSQNKGESFGTEK